MHVCTTGKVTFGTLTNVDYRKVIVSDPPPPIIESSLSESSTVYALSTPGIAYQPCSNVQHTHKQCYIHIHFVHTYMYICKFF